MNKTILNEIIIKALRAGDVLSGNVDICPVEQEMPIDIRRFQNPITDDGDVRTQSIDASERIADLINSFGAVSDIEECYMIILSGIQQVSFASNFCLEEIADDIMVEENAADGSAADWYVALSREVQKMNAQQAGEKTDESV